MTVARAFLKEIIDYAGLFPPASLSMPEAIKAYAAYRAGSDSDLLGRFIVPVSRLSEFSSSLRSLESEIARSGTWHVSAIPAADNEKHRAEIEDFNERHAAGESSFSAIIDAIEMPVADALQVRRAADLYGEFFAVFLEPTPLSQAVDLLPEICTAGAAAKIRTGGVVDSAIPSAEAVLSFMDCCADIGLRFKATAGLHHAIRGSYPLTYEPTASRGTMFGFLNVFLAAAYRRTGLDRELLLDLLQESDSSSITFDDNGASWRGNRVTAGDLIATRASVATSFGSCSFSEPVDEARQLHLI